MDEWVLRLHALVIFRGLRGDDVLRRLLALLEARALPVERRVDTYAAFAQALFAHTLSLTEYVRGRVLDDDNIYVRRRARQLPVDAELEACLQSELQTLAGIAQLKSADVRAQLGYDGYLPEWRTDDTDLWGAFVDRMETLGQRGYGIYATHRMFGMRDGSIRPIKSPDGVRLADLKGYGRQKKAVTDNTLALLDGCPAANVLLYGDAGTGKSSTVKALVNEYHNRGLRLIELSKTQLGDIPGVMEELWDNPLKFILFIDDLSFGREGDDFFTLKAVLEGSASARARNVAVYATSNRRHMIKERFSEREGDDVHRNETMQEMSALSARFGLTVGFFKPGRQQYLQIVHALKDEYGLCIDDETLEAQAERFAISGRSPRAARQFIDVLRMKMGQR